MAGKLDYPATWTSPPRGRVAVVAPHPDDESIGCGGVLALHRAQGDAVHVIVVTDGDAGDPEGRYPRDGYVALRRDECRRAVALLGGAAPGFLGFADGRVEDAAPLREALRTALHDAAPDIVYHPAIAEMHRDHHVVGVVALRACAELERPVRTFAYEVWAPVVPTHVIDVSAVWGVKLAAVRCYASQLAYNDYARAVAGLNAYRTVFLPHASHVEAFAETTSGRGAAAAQ